MKQIVALSIALCAACGAAEAAGPGPLAPVHLVPPAAKSLSSNARERATLQPALNCKTAPCVLGNVMVSGQQGPVVETPIAVDPSNSKNIIAAGVDYSCSPEVYTLQGFYVTTDGGKTWTDECGTITPSATYGDGDPFVAYDLKGNVYRGGINVVISGQTGQWVIALAKSTDHGMSWNTPVIATQLDGISSDKPWIAIDNNPNSKYKNNIYVSSTGFDSYNDTAIDFSRSTDGGKTWTTVVASPEAISPTEVESSDIAIGRDGTVYLAYLDCLPPGNTQNCVRGTVVQYLQKSTDGGATWSSPVAMMTVANGNCHPYDQYSYWACLRHSKYARIVDYPAIAIDNSNGVYSGRLYSVCWNWTGTFMQMLFSSSSDGGNTWAAPVPVAPKGDDHDQFFPWVDVSTSGLVAITWLDRGNDPKNKEYETFAAVSGDGGAKFTDYQLATKPSNPNHTGVPGFLGDYRTNVWEGANKLLAVWPDTRSGVGRAEVGGFKH